MKFVEQAAPVLARARAHPHFFLSAPRRRGTGSASQSATIHIMEGLPASPDARRAVAATASESTATATATMQPGQLAVLLHNAINVLETRACPWSGTNQWNVKVSTVSRIASAVDSMAAPFSTAMVLPNFHVSLTVNEGTQSFCVPDLSSLSTENLDALKRAACRSAFGHGEETVVDARVRDGWEISASRLTLSIDDHFAKRTMYGLQDLAQELVGYNSDLERSASLRLHKLCLYEAGGHFAPHVDAVHQPNHVATLLVALPTPHEGGELIVHAPHARSAAHGSSESTDPGQGVRFAFGNTRAGEPVGVAFFTDCVHEVKPVTSGIRVMLQFDVVLDAPSEARDSATSVPVVRERGGIRAGSDGATSEDSNAAADTSEDVLDQLAAADRPPSPAGPPAHDVRLGTATGTKPELVAASTCLPSREFWGHDSDGPGGEPAITVWTWQPAAACAEPRGGEHALVKAMRERLARKPTKHVAILLRHLYSRCVLEPALLRGADATAWRVLAAAGEWEMCLTPVMVYATWDSMDRGCHHKRAGPLDDFGVARAPAVPDWCRERGVLIVSASASLLTMLAKAIHTGNGPMDSEQWYMGAAMVIRAPGVAAGGRGSGAASGHKRTIDGVQQE